MEELEYYLIKYRVTSANAISNAIETYTDFEDVDAKYYENVVDAMTNANLKYVMLSILDSNGNDIRHTNITCPGEEVETSKYFLTEYIHKTDKTTTSTIAAFDTFEEAEDQLNIDISSILEDNTIVSMNSTIISLSGNIEKVDMTYGAGYLNYRGKYLLFVNKYKTDGTLNPTIQRKDSYDEAELSVYRLLADNIDDTTLLAIECRVEDAYGNTVLREFKQCKGELPTENENDENIENE